MKLFHWFDCACKNSNHAMRVYTDPDHRDMITFEFHLNVSLPWYRRLIEATKFVFARRGTCTFDEYIMLKEEADKLKGIIDWMK